MLTEAVAYMAKFTRTSVFTWTSVNNKVHTGSINSHFKEQQYFLRAVLMIRNPRVADLATSLEYFLFNSWNVVAVRNMTHVTV